MNTETIVAHLRWGMETLPFPALLLYLILFGLLWLLVEAWLTRTGRALPGWRKPFPVLPWISEVAVWLTRASSWLLWTWAIFYFVLVAVHWAAAQEGGQNLTGVSAPLLDLAALWRQGYSLLVSLLPPAVVQALPGV